jgi:hypothetical protein
MIMLKITHKLAYRPMPFLGGISFKLNTFMLLSNIESAIVSFKNHMLVV